MTPEARDLIAAFQVGETQESAAALVNDDGFDLSTIRVLTAWKNLDHKWVSPGTQPDGGKATPRAWAWLVRGMRVDYVAIADAAGVSRGVARARLGLLLGNRLLYPDGQIAKVARAVLQAAIARRVRKGAPRPSDPQPAPKPQTN